MSTFGGPESKARKPPRAAFLPTTFPGTNFGPLRLREALRALLEPGEKIVGWGIAQHEPEPHRAALSVSLMLIPIFGQMLASVDAVMAMQRQRVVVLTDRRLLLLKTDSKALAGDGSGVTFEGSLGEIELEDRDEAARWWIDDDPPVGHPIHPNAPVPPQPGSPRPTPGERRRAKRNKAKNQQPDLEGTARIRLSAPGVEPWTMRITPGKAGGAQRLVEALRVLAGRDRSLAEGALSTDGAGTPDRPTPSPPSGMLDRTGTERERRAT